MIVLDTNVLSELMKPERARSPEVKQWMRGKKKAALFASAPAVAELRAGVEVLPDGARKRAIDEAVEALLAEFDTRVLPFSLDAAWAFGKIVARRRSAGRPTANPIDLQIAAIARVAGMAVATRNVTDFQECGVEVVDPWTA
jgi:predicted nucleic acid-binding protein